MVGLNIFFLAFISGASMNPARSLTPALVSGVLNNLWLYWSATFIGTSVSPLCSEGCLYQSHNSVVVVYFLHTPYVPHRDHIILLIHFKQSSVKTFSILILNQMFHTVFESALNYIHPSFHKFIICINPCNVISLP